MKSFISLATLIFATYGQADEFLAKKSKETKVFVNKDCELTKTCDLKKFEITVTREANQANGKRLYSNTYMEGYYETESVADVEKYAIVQFIKGGAFNEVKLTGEAIKTYRGSNREFFGEKRFPFVHPRQVVDSFDLDPIYASYEERNDRHGLYKIKKDETRSVLFDNSKYYTYYFYRPELKTAKMHFSDMPTGGSFSAVTISAGPNAGKVSYGATNASMEFVTCVFKTKNVPPNAGPEGVKPEQAIGCLEWSNHHVYDWNQKVFINLETPDPRALQVSFEE